MSKKKPRFEIDVRDDQDFEGRNLVGKELMARRPDGPYLTDNAFVEARKLVPQPLLERLYALADDFRALEEVNTYVGDVTTLLYAAGNVAEYCRRPRGFDRALNDLEDQVTMDMAYISQHGMRHGRQWGKHVVRSAKASINYLADPWDEKLYGKEPVGPKDAVGLPKAIRSALFLVNEALMLVPGLRDRIDTKMYNNACAEIALVMTPRSVPYDLARKVLRLLGMPAKPVDAALASSRKAEIKKRKLRIA